MALSFGLSLISEAITAGGASLNLPLAGATALDSRVTFTRGSNATMVGSDGLLQYAPNNLKTYSDAILVANGYGVNNATLTTVTTQTPLQGVTTASKFALNSGASTGNDSVGWSFGGGVNLTPSTLHSQYIVVKADGASIVRLRSNVTGLLVDVPIAGPAPAPVSDLVACSVVQLGDGWAGISWSFISTASGLPGTRSDYWAIKTNVADGTSGFLVTGAQLNVGALQPYYPTTSAAYYGPRLVYDPATLAAQGLLVEEQRTNTIRNNMMVGAVAGTPGTLPTNWSYYTALTGLTRQVVGTGIEDGVSYVDIRISGTPSASGSVNYYTETSTAVAAVVGQTWAESSYFKLQAGSLAGITATRLYLQENNSGGGYLVEQNFTVSAPTTAALALQRSTATRTLTNASTAFLMPGFNLLLSGAAIDITLRIGMPQLELGAFATSVIPTTTAQATRAADVATMTGTNFSSWYNQTEGTLIAEESTLRGASGFGGFYSINDTSGSNRIDARFQNGGFFSVIQSGGVDSAVFQPSGTVVANTLYKFALAFKLNDFAACVNAGTVLTDTSGAMPIAVNRMQLGCLDTGGQILCGTIKSITYYPRRLADTELQALTS